MLEKYQIDKLEACLDGNDGICPQFSFKDDNFIFHFISDGKKNRLEINEIIEMKFSADRTPIIGGYSFFIDGFDIKIEKGIYHIAIELVGAEILIKARKLLFFG